MGQQFRNSLFGFNKEDVLSFAIGAKEKEKQLTRRIEQAEIKSAETEEKLNTVTEELSAALKEIEKLNIELQNYRDREETLTKLSESIGKLYLVAKANAKSIIEMAEASVKASSELVDRNIEIAENTENGIEALKNSFKEKADNLFYGIEEIKKELSAVKDEAKLEREKSGEYITDTVNMIESIGAKLDDTKD